VPPRAAKLGVGEGALRVLIALGYHANAEGDCWPSLATLAKDCGYTFRDKEGMEHPDRRRIPPALVRLEKTGLIKRQRRESDRGDATSTVYHLVMDNERVSCVETTPTSAGVSCRETTPVVLRDETGVVPEDDTGVVPEDDTGVVLRDDTQYEQPNLDSPSQNNPTRTHCVNTARDARLDTHTESVSDSRVEDQKFHVFLKLFPIKKNKMRARLSFSAALKKASFETILGAAAAYARECWQNPDNFVSHPATWLDHERWLDECEGDPISASEIYVELGYRLPVDFRDFQCWPTVRAVEDEADEVDGDEGDLIKIDNIAQAVE
jgi:hypothetical protein